MKVNLKTKSELESMKKAGKVCGEVLSSALKLVKPGVKELELDSFIDRKIIEANAYPGFKKVKGYFNATCICVNDVVVHGIPRDKVLKNGDVVCIDTGVYMDGLHTDMAETVIVKDNNMENKNLENLERFLLAGKRAMYAGISEAKPGNRVGSISKAMQDIIEKENGYSVVRSLVGHGVGRELHEDPQIPGYLSGKIEKTFELQENMTIAIEIIYNMGKRDVEYEGTDDWTIVSSDHSISAVFERTIVITDKGPELITRFPGEKISYKH